MGLYLRLILELFSTPFSVRLTRGMASDQLAILKHSSSPCKPIVLHYWCLTVLRASPCDTPAAPRWEALLVVADDVAFRNLAAIVADLHDDRVWIYAEWIGSDFRPKVNGAWAPGYHGEAAHIQEGV
jgi:hypothetical protein